MDDEFLKSLGIGDEGFAELENKLLVASQVAAFENLSNNISAMTYLGNQWVSSYQDFIKRASSRIQKIAEIDGVDEQADGLYDAHQENLTDFSKTFSRFAREMARVSARVYSHNASQFSQDAKKAKDQLDSMTRHDSDEAPS